MCFCGIGYAVGLKVVVLEGNGMVKSDILDTMALRRGSRPASVTKKGLKCWVCLCRVGIVSSVGGVVVTKGIW
jgi:hypothetical protein